MAPPSARLSETSRSRAPKRGRQPGGAARPADGARAGWLDFLQCPHCDGALDILSDVIVCAACHRPVSYRDNIVDFVGGQQTTKLDSIDYDEFYKISVLQSAAQFRQVVETAAGRWPDQLGAVLEIGSGTGGFTMGLVQSGLCAQAVLTDVSPKMLEICQRHLGALNVLDPRRIGFATYGGTENCFRPNAFDSCVGAWVVHHIIDVPRFFRQVLQTLKPGGRAFFLEPNQRFHQALIAALCDVIDHKLRKGMDLAAPDIVNTMTWIAETRFNIVNSGDLAALAGREDKHLFIGEALERMALDAGFDGAESLAFGYDPQGVSTARAYLSQCQVSEAWIGEVERLLPSIGEPYFSLLHARDQAPSFLVWLTRAAEPGTTLTSGGAAAPAAGLAETMQAEDVRYWLDFTRLDAMHADAVVVEGWCLAPVGIKALELTFGTQTMRLCPHRPRLDVHRAINGGRIFPSVHSLCSGLDGILTWAGLGAGPLGAGPLGAGPLGDGPAEARLLVTARTVKGVAIVLGEVVLPGWGQTVTLKH